MPSPVREAEGRKPGRNAQAPSRNRTPGLARRVPGAHNRHMGDAEHIEAFLDAIWAERGLSDNSLDSYRRDLKKLSAFLQQRGSGLLSASREVLLAYLGLQMREGRSPRSVARYLS